MAGKAHEANGLFSFLGVRFLFTFSVDVELGCETLVAMDV